MSPPYGVPQLMTPCRPPSFFCAECHHFQRLISRNEGISPAFICCIVFQTAIHLSNMGCLVGLENDVVLCMTAHISKYFWHTIWNNILLQINTNVCVFIIKSLTLPGNVIVIKNRI